MGLTLDGYPTWSQNADPDPTLGTDPYERTDCGEECCAIVQFGAGLGYVTETQVRDAMPGHGGHGETTGSDIATYLESIGLVAASIAIAPQILQLYIKKRVALGRPLILLGYWVVPTVLHWVVVIGYGNDHMFYIDVWDGRVKALHWKQVRALYFGTGVEIGPQPTHE